MVDTCVGFRDNISIWHVPGRTYFRSNFDYQMKALILDKHYDYPAINNNFPGGRLPATWCQTIVGPHMSSDTITEVRQYRLAAVLLLGYVYNRSRQILGCRIVVSSIYHGNLRSAMSLDGKTAGDAAWQSCIVS